MTARPARGHGLTALVAALTALPALAIDMGLPALPDLARSFGVGAGAAQLSIGLFLAGFAAAQLACGPLADRFGRRPVLLAGLGLFAAAAAGCAVAASLPVLLGCRILQGVGACVGTVLACAIVRDLFSGEAAAARLAQAAAIMALAPMAAPAIGAVVLAAAGWRAIFLVLALAGLALLLTVAARLPETIPPADPEALRLRAFARNAAGFFRCRTALGNALAAACLYGGMFAYIAASPFALMEALGVGSGGYAGLFALTALGIMAGALAAPRLVREGGASPAVQGGLAIGAVATLCLLALITVSDGTPSLVAVVIPVAVYTFARGLVVPVATAAAMEPMRGSAGLASGLVGALQMAAAALAASLAGLFADPLLGLAAIMALFAATALACGQLASGAVLVFSPASPPYRSPRP